MANYRSNHRGRCYAIILLIYFYSKNSKENNNSKANTKNNKRRPKFLTIIILLFIFIYIRLFCFSGSHSRRCFFFFHCLFLVARNSFSNNLRLNSLIRFILSFAIRINILFFFPSSTLRTNEIGVRICNGIVHSNLRGFSSYDCSCYSSSNTLGSNTRNIFYCSYNHDRSILHQAFFTCLIHQSICNFRQTMRFCKNAANYFIFYNITKCHTA